MHVTTAAARFDAWVDEVGVDEAARSIACGKSFISHVRSGRKTPGLATAALIERATQGSSVGTIVCSDWVPAPSDKTDEEAADAHDEDVSAPTGEAA